MPAADSFGSLVHAINKPRRRDFDGRTVIVVERRIHDTVNAVVTVLLKRGEIIQYEAGLAYRSDGKRPIAVTLPWLSNHLRERFKFLEHGEPVELPPAVARFVLRRWAAFPEVYVVPAYDKRRSLRKRQTAGAK